VISVLGHLIGIHAPGSQSLPEALAVGHHLLLAHGNAVEVAKSNVRDAKVGITLNLTHVYPTSDKGEDLDAARIADGTFNRWYLDPVFGREYPEDIVAMFGDAMPEIRAGDFTTIARETDFLGINTYNPIHVNHDPNGLFGAVGTPRVGGKRTATDWIVEPDGFRDLLVRVQTDYAPAHVFVTENGSAWNDPDPVNGRVEDPDRIEYLHGHLLAARDAIALGVNLEGYFAWSLLDNFEWSEGYSKRFGIVHVDYATQERTIKDSGRFYTEVIRANGENL
jgi:beta-glucosidase